MGTVVAQDIFQSKLDSIFISMEGVTGIADDMVIAGRDEMEHDRNFLAFVEKCMSNNLTLNLEEIQFKQTQVSFYGHCWSKHRISPDPKKIQALKHMEFPLDKETMRSFLGMINYLNRYSALSAHLTAPLSVLTQATDYKLGKVHSENFNRLKVEISNMKALPYFNVNAETTLQMDASKKVKLYVMLPGHSPRLSRITRIWNERHWELSGEWKSSTTSCMVRNLHWKQSRSHL